LIPGVLFECDGGFLHHFFFRTSDLPLGNCLFHFLSDLRIQSNDLLQPLSSLQHPQPS
jgi:hypothetical protein